VASCSIQGTSRTDHHPDECVLTQACVWLVEVCVCVSVMRLTCLAR
jgi:hypothetical protein